MATVAEALAFEDVTHLYRGKVAALRAVNFAVGRGTTACLLGPNGAGKSTAIRLLQGALTPTVGRVRILGVEAADPNALEARRRTGIVPQNPGMYADLTVAEYLEVVRRLYARGDVGRVVDLFTLGPYLGTPMARLSGGFQRRLTLAAAMLSEPELLLLDEPTAGLDPVSTHEVREHLRQLLPGRTALLCTHDLAEAELLCDDVVILERGRLVLHDRLARLRGERSRVRLMAVQGTGALAAAVRSRGLSADEADGAVLVAIDGNAEASVPDLLRSLLAEGLDVLECTIERRSLEAAFLDAVRGGTE